MTENKNNIADAIDEKDKQCSKCGEIEPLSAFSKDGRQKLGVRAEGHLHIKTPNS